jgi:hypothetical protein
MIDDWLRRIDVYETLTLTYAKTRTEVARFAGLYVVADEPKRALWVGEVGDASREHVQSRLEFLAAADPAVHWRPNPAGTEDPFRDCTFSYDCSGSGYRGTWTLQRQPSGLYLEVSEDWIDDPAGATPATRNEKTHDEAAARAALCAQMRFTTSNEWLMPYIKR